MSRAVLALDRIVTLILGLVLLLGGLAAVAWWAGQLRRLWPATPGSLRLGPARGALEAAWWPWAAGVAGAVAILLGLWWLVSHIPRRSVPTLPLPGGEVRGGLRLDPNAATATAAEVLAQTPGVRSARGTMRDDRGELVAALDATIEPTADLTTVVAAAERVSAELGHVLDLPAARCRVQLRVARRGRRPARVS